MNGEIAVVHAGIGMLNGEIGIVEGAVLTAQRWILASCITKLSSRCLRSTHVAQMQTRAQQDHADSGAALPARANPDASALKRLAQHVGDAALKGLHLPRLLRHRHVLRVVCVIRQRDIQAVAAAKDGF